MNAFAAPPRSAAATVGTKNPRAVKQLGLFLSLHSSIPSWVSSTGGEQETFASLAAHYLIRHLQKESQGTYYFMSTQPSQLFFRNLMA